MLTVSGIVVDVAKVHVAVKREFSVRNHHTGIELHRYFNATFVAFVARIGTFVANVSIAILAYGRFCIRKGAHRNVES